MFIAVEGADGSGKTTLCAELAKRTGAVSYVTPPKKYSRSRKRIDELASMDEHYRFYRNAVYDASDEIKALLRKGCAIVCDRYWLSTYASHKAMGVSIPKTDFGAIIKPTLTVVLALNHQVRLSRIARREMSTCERRMAGKQQEIADEFYKGAITFNLPFILIDTQHFSPEDCTELVVKATGF